jgi:hypothetical protein
VGISIPFENFTVAEDIHNSLHLLTLKLSKDQKKVIYAENVVTHEINLKALQLKPLDKAIG